MLLCTYCSFFDFFDIKTNTIPLLFLQDRFFSSVSLLSCLDIQLFESFCIVFTFFTIFIIYYVYYRSHDSSAISLTYEYFQMYFLWEKQEGNLELFLSFTDAQSCCPVDSYIEQFTLTLSSIDPSLMIFHRYTPLLLTILTFPYIYIHRLPRSPFRIQEGFGSDSSRVRFILWNSPDGQII